MILTTHVALSSLAIHWISIRTCIRLEIDILEGKLSAENAKMRLRAIEIELRTLLEPAGERLANGSKLAEVLRDFDVLLDKAELIGRASW